MHYRHAFHAGNFADVFKHVLLVGLLQALSRKDKPWCYLDTHAGAGSYDLASDDADRTGEWRDGVGRLQPDAAAPAMVGRYLELLAWPGQGSDQCILRHSRVYPGSPALAAKLARPGDRVVCCEHEPEIAAQLRAHVPTAQVHVRDGYEAHGLLPPREKRGLMLLDPPFESRAEFERAHALLVQAASRFATGIHAFWYPLKNRHEADRTVRRIQRDTACPSLNCTLENGAPGEGQMRGCGLLVLNPPFGFADEARAALAWITPRLAQGPRPRWTVEVG